MKVLFGTFSAATVLGGGVKVQVDALARELERLGVIVERFNPWKDYRLSDFDLFHLFSANVGTFHLGRAMKGQGIKLVVSPVFFSRHSPRRVATMIAVAKRFRKKGGFWTEHLFCKELCNMADLVLPNTRTEADLIIQAFSIPGDKVSIIPNGVDERFYYAKPDEFIRQYGIKNFVLYAGHIGLGRKNVLPFLKVMKELNLPTVLIGRVIDNEYGNRCRKIIRQSPNITHIPVLPPNSPLLGSAYAACDTIVLPSFYETPGLAALEAGLAGAKVCITKFGGTVEYFGQYANYLDPYSESSIKESVNEAVTKPKSPELREHIRTHFLWGEAGTRLLQAYHLLTAGNI
ncbi:hypothetical protein CH330_04310 [candidate division WOR-3 bacterium JGI_Cruoil_03_51_56]|uniref:Glycosyl transferase family 1 domain-containing protein n=1 Tax=candidate division WOR-3 bacterium JGI_Cruoil_03_51_56 TaxID=1973747 RepID=A0A235BTU0_UNCW3|nr:MAG: hypothetical protein CH330_04310 [candidate division WOR-3 bacterium JGI_Cruoil_03_51_56]